MSSYNSPSAQPNPSYDFDRYYSQLERELFEPSFSITKGIRYIENTDPEGQFHLFKFLYSNLFVVSGFFKDCFKSLGLDRGFLEGSESQYTAFEVLYLFSETVNTNKKIDKLLVHNPGDDFLEDFTSKANKLNKVNKALNEKEVDKKLFNWFYYQYEQSGANAERVCDFIKKGLEKIYDITRNFLASVAQYISDLKAENVDSEGVGADEDDVESEYPVSPISLNDPNGQCHNFTLAEHEQHLQVILGDDSNLDVVHAAHSLIE